MTYRQKGEENGPKPFKSHQNDSQNGSKIDEKSIQKAIQLPYNQKERKNSKNQHISESLVLHKCTNRKGETLVFTFSPIL